MKRKAITAAAGVVLVLTAFLIRWIMPPKAPPLSLPESGGISLMEIEHDGKKVETDDPDRIDGLLRPLREARPTHIASVRDTPESDDIYILTVFGKDGDRLEIFVYKNDGDKHVYAELPYQGVYETDPDAMDQLAMAMISPGCNSADSCAGSRKRCIRAGSLANLKMLSIQVSPLTAAYLIDRADLPV